MLQDYIAKYGWKPLLTSNDPSGVKINWEVRIPDPQNWLVSEKLDGARVELCRGKAYSRTGKLIPSIHVQKMADVFYSHTNHEGIVEAEFHAEGYTFSELMHFFKTEDVTSEKTRKKYTRLWDKHNGQPYWVNTQNGMENKGWPFPGRSLGWAIDWRKDFEFRIFDWIMPPAILITKEVRVSKLNRLKSPVSRPIQQLRFDTVEEILDFTAEVIRKGGEGSMVFRKDSVYKNGRYTLKSNQAYKIKDNMNIFKGLILDVFETTVAKEGSEKSVDNFGHSKTSQLKEDRVPSGLAGGFVIELPGSSNTLKVGLKGFDHEQRRKLLMDPRQYLGKVVEFYGMPPVKLGGVPRHAHYVKPNA